MVLVASDVCKEYGHRQVLAGVSVGINPGDRIALVGANGAGKSTLLRILAGVEAPDDGKVSRGKHDELGYLPQSMPVLAGSTIEEVIATSVASLRQMELRMRELEEAMGNPDGSEPSVLEEYGDVSSHFESRGGYELQSAISQVLAGLGVGHLNLDRPVGQLSGGEKARVGLAALLLAAPDVLLLDEPTNDLDETALRWLQAYLISYRGGIMLVSHDRDFIDAICSAIVELDEHNHELSRFEGNYERYLQAKAAGRTRAQQAYDVQQEEIRMLKERAATTARAVSHNRAARDNDKYLYNFKGSGVERAVSRNVRAAREQLERLEANLLQPPPEPLQFRVKLSQGRLTKTDIAVEARNLAAAYPPRVVLDNINCHLQAGDRICLIGPNGAGKSTLMRILAKQTLPDSGEVTYRRGLRIGYLPQEPTLPAPDKTVGQNITIGLNATGLPGVGDEARGWLVRWGLITREDLAKRISDLSIGQQRKVELGILIGSDPDVLLLDEPTNHLSFDVIESLQDALMTFGGPILIVTHDRRLKRQFPAVNWELTDGKLIEYEVERENPND